MKRRGIVFDWGGVIVRTEDYGPRHEWDERLGLGQGAVERTVHGIEAWRQAQRGEMPVDDYWQAVAEALDLDEKEAARLRADFYSGDRLNTDVVELIRDLRVHGVPVGLLSNNTPELADEMVERQVEALFDACVISADIGVMKPDPQAYRAILDKLSVPAEDAIFVDDFAENVEGAQAVGMAGVHYQPGMELREVLGEWLRVEL